MTRTARQKPWDLSVRIAGALLLGYTASAGAMEVHTLQLDPLTSHIEVNEPSAPVPYGISGTFQTESFARSEAFAANVHVAPLAIFAESIPVSPGPFAFPDDLAGLSQGSGNDLSGAGCAYYDGPGICYPAEPPESSGFAPGTFDGQHRAVPGQPPVTKLFDLAEVPEPTTIALLLAGLVGLAMRERRKRRARRTAAPAGLDASRHGAGFWSPPA